MKIDKDILKIIETGTSEGNLYYLPKVQLDRKIYMKVNKVLELLGGKWNKKLKAHVFPGSIEDAIDSVLLTGEVKDVKKELQFFETSPELAKRLVDMAEIDETMNCLEPSAGRGRIADAIAKVLDKQEIICYDINPDFIKCLEESGFKAIRSDFLTVIPCVTEYDRVVMNPPFTRQQDIDHVLHALTFLRSGGVLVSVMSKGVMFRHNSKTENFWKEVYAQESYDVVELPEGTFKSSGTMVNTIIIKIVKG
jgi:predicted RNA methylase